MTERARTNPFLRIYPVPEEGFSVEEPLAGDRYEHVDPSLVSYLLDLDRWTPMEEAVQLAEELFPTDAVLSYLLDRRLVVTGGSEVAETWAATEGWRQHGWTAGLAYHLFVRTVEFVEYESADRWRREHDTSDPPDCYKTYPDAETRPLPPPGGELFDGGFWDALCGDASTAAGTPFDRASLSDLLYYAFGETDHDVDPDAGRLLHKTSPSAGARHPTEAYVAVATVDGVDPGVYHYSVVDHALERIGSDATGDLGISHHGPPGGRERDPSLVFLFSQRVERNMDKYRDPRAFRTIQYDVGHLYETVRFLAAGRGRPVDVDPGVDIDAAADLLQLDPYEEPVFGKLCVY